MEKVLLLIMLRYSFSSAKDDILSKTANGDLETAHSDRVLYQYVPPLGYPQASPAPTIPYVDVYNPQQNLNAINGYIAPSLAVLPGVDVSKALHGNPLLAALLLSASLGISTKTPGLNHPEHLPLNPYVALLLSQYGRYVPIYGKGYGIYGYGAANNYHNNKPFGAYKIYEDPDN